MKTDPPFAHDPRTDAVSIALGLPLDARGALDDARRRLGYPSRAALLRRALYTFFLCEDEHEVAAHFLREEAIECVSPDVTSPSVRGDSQASRA